MKVLLFCFLITLTIHLQAQQAITDSSTNLTSKQLNLTPEQEITIRKLIWEYKLDERKRRRMLRHRIFLVLNRNQQIVVRRWWRRQIKSSIKG